MKKVTVKRILCILAGVITLAGMTLPTDRYKSTYATETADSPDGVSDNTADNTGTVPSSSSETDNPQANADASITEALTKLTSKNNVAQSKVDASAAGWHYSATINPSSGSATYRIEVFYNKDYAPRICVYEGTNTNSKIIFGSGVKKNDAGTVIMKQGSALADFPSHQFAVIYITENEGDEPKTLYIDNNEGSSIPDLFVVQTEYSEENNGEMKASEADDSEKRLNPTNVLCWSYNAGISDLGNSSTMTLGDEVTQLLSSDIGTKGSAPVVSEKEKQEQQQKEEEEKQKRLLTLLAVVLIATAGGGLYLTSRTKKSAQAKAGKRKTERRKKKIKQAYLNQQKKNYQNLKRDIQGYTDDDDDLDEELQTVYGWEDNATQYEGVDDDDENYQPMFVQDNSEKIRQEIEDEENEKDNNKNVNDNGDNEWNDEDDELDDDTIIDADHTRYESNIEQKEIKEEKPVPVPVRKKQTQTRPKPRPVSKSAAEPVTRTASKPAASGRPAPAVNKRPVPRPKPMAEGSRPRPKVNARPVPRAASQTTGHGRPRPVPNPSTGRRPVPTTGRPTQRINEPPKRMAEAKPRASRSVPNGEMGTVQRRHRYS